MKKLFITDLDGTALGGNSEPYARFPDIFSEFLDSLAARGHGWGVNTTWDVGGQWDLINISSVGSRPEYLMAEFGLRLASVKSGKPEFVQPYTRDMEERLKDIQRRKLNPLIHELTGGFEAARIMFYGHLLSFELAKHENIDKFKQYIKKFFADEELICQFNGGIFSVRPAFMTKARPFSEISLSPEQIIVAGDEVTDLAMMQPEIAMHYICPANAVAEVKEHVAKHNGEIGELPYGAGVIQAFQKLSKRYNWGIN
jgi:hydroxymethylpyrimidine pyrophosphatase-like HAD family hydrolase